MTPSRPYDNRVWARPTLAWPWILWRTGRTPWPRRIHPWGTTIVLLGQVLAPLFALLHAIVEQGLGFLGDQAEPPWNVLAALIYVTMLAVAAAAGVILIVRAWVNWHERKDVDPWAEQEAPTPEA